MLMKKTLLLLIALITLSFSVQATYWVYQENATSYGQFQKSGWVLGEGVDDNGWWMVINYTKPTSAISGRWDVSHGANASLSPYELHGYNISLPSSCFQQEPLQLAVQTFVLGAEGPGPIQYSSPRCYNGTDWQLIGSARSAASQNPCEGTPSFSLTYDGDWNTRSVGCGDNFYILDSESWNREASVWEEAMNWEIEGVDVNLLPDDPMGNDTLEGHVNCTEGNQSLYNVSYEWYRNSILFNSSTFTGLVGGVLTNVANITPSNLVIGDTWGFKARCEYGPNQTVYVTDSDLVEVFCGAELNGTIDYTMTQDLNCENYQDLTYFIRTFKYNATFDCAGHSIRGTQSDTTATAFTDLASGGFSRQPMTIKNCILNNVSGIGTSKDMVTLDNLTYYGLCGNAFGAPGMQGSGIVIKNTKIYSTAPSCFSRGVRSTGLEDLTIVNNTWHTTTSPIVMLVDEDNWTVTNNIFNSSDNTTVDTANELTTITNIFLNSSYNCSSANILGGQCKGGNFWSANPNRDLDADGIAEEPYLVFSFSAVDFYDYLPLAVQGEFGITISRPLSGENFTHQSHIPLNFTFSLESLNASNCWWNLNNGMNNTISCSEGQVSSTFIDTTPGSNTVYVFVNTTTSDIVTNSTTFITQNDSTAPIISISYPTNTTNITASSLNATFEVNLTITEIGEISQCRYNHYNSSGLPTTETGFACTTGLNQLSIVSGYYGTHIFVVTVNDSENNIGTSSVTFNIQQQAQPPAGPTGGGGGSEKEVEVLVPFFVREENFDFTCGVDADQDGLLCDANEDWISCPDDCEFPQLDELLCFGGEHCVWREAWFLKMLFAMMLLITIYLVYTDLKMPSRKRKIFT